MFDFTNQNKPRYFELRLGNLRLEITYNAFHGDDYAYERIALLGFCRYEFPSVRMQKFRKHEDGEICTSMFGSEELEDSGTNPDVFLSFCRWHIDNYVEKNIAKIAVVCEHPFWMFHDITHIEGKDIISCEGNITASLERYRLEEGFKLMKKHGVYTMGTDYGELLEESFRNRFREGLGLHKYYEELEENVYY